MNKLHNSFIWSFLEQAGSKAVALVVQIVLARLLAPEAFGLLAIMLVVVDLGTVLAQSGLGMALIQAEDCDADTCTTAFWLSLVLSVVLYAVAFLTAPLIASFYGMPKLDACLKAIALAMPLNAANSIQRSILQRNMDFKSIFKSNTMAFALSGAIGIAAALNGAGVWALVWQTVTQPAVACAFMAAYAKWHPTMAFDPGKARGLFSYGWKICVSGIFGIVERSVSELIIGKAVGADALGLYSQGRKWPNAGIHVVSNALQNVMFPAFASLQDDAERLRAAVRKALRVGNFVMVPLSLLFVVVASPVVNLLLSSKWDPCVPVFQMTFAANCVVMLQLVNLRAYMALGDSGLYLKLQIIKVALNCFVVGAVAFLSRDIYATAFASTLCALFGVLVVDLTPAKRIHGVGRSEQLRGFAPVVIVGLIAVAISYPLAFLALHDALTLILQAAAYAAAYLAMARAFRLPGFDDCVSMAHSLVSGRG